MFSKSVGVGDPNKAEVLAILEALRFFSEFCHCRLIVESDSSNVISCVSKGKTRL